jgi:hypothetical protein
MWRTAALLAFGLALAPGARAVELDGYWYVLVHYQDSASNKPEAWRWDDRVWRFVSKDGRLEWTEYPIVSFQNETGRFEALSGNRAARVVAAWEPNADQLADIKDGLAANSRGVKTKTLRSDGDASAWTSGEGAGPDSAMVITYSETWSIEGLPDAPIFTRDDSMGGASAEAMEGRTQYRTESVLENGEELRGGFDRDGTRKGRFRMIRSSEVGAAGEQDLEERQRKALRQRAIESGIVTPEEVQAAIGAQVKLAPGAKIDDRSAARVVIRQNIEDAVKAQGEDPRLHAGAIDGLARKVERLLFDEGKSVEEVQAMIASGQLRP